MRTTFLVATIACLTACPAFADKLAEHKAGSDGLAEEQDNLSADVQQLVIEQTHPKVIELLGEVENIMDEVVELLAEADTGGKTLAAQTEIIEKIHAAAKERQQQQGSGKSGGAMMDMMERMMGKEPGEKGKGKGKQGEPGNEAGQGNGGLSDAGNENNGGKTSGADDIRRVPKASGTAGSDIPAEFRNAFDAYNRGLDSTTR